MINPRFLTSLLLLGALAGRVSASLPPEAQDLVDQGIEAGRENEHQQAIEYFRAALALAPDAPEIFLTLGVAESNLPGRELRAMAWFGAYMSARPEADNFTVVSNQFLKLEARYQANVSHVLTIAEDAAKRFGDPQNFDRVDALRRVAVLWAGNGDIEKANAAIESIPYPNSKRDAQEGIATAQARAGDIQGALETATGSPEETGPWDSDHKGNANALNAIAKIQAETGDIAGAQETAASINEDDRHRAQSEIIRAQIKAGDFTSALETAGSVQNLFSQESALCSVATAQAMAGDIDGALETTSRIEPGVLKNWTMADVAGARAKFGDVAGAEEIAGSIADPDFNTMAWRKIAEGQARAGDIDGALTTAKSIKDTDSREIALREIVEAQSSVGEIAGAQETAAGIRDAKEQGIALSYIAEAQVKSGDLAAAQETVDNIQDSSLKDKPQRLIDLARAANGSTNPWVLIITDQLNDPVFLDLAAYLESLPTDDGQRSFDRLCDAANKMIKARQLLKELLARGTEVSADRSQPE